MFQWLIRLFQRKKAAPKEPGIHPSELAVIPQGYDNPSEARIETRLVSRAQAKQIEEAREMVKQSNHDLTLSQAHAVLSAKDEGPRAEMVVEPADGMSLPILPADLAPETVAVPRLPQDDAEATRRLPPLSERMGKNNRRRGLEDEA
jgi:hypothetical protein